MQSAEALCSRTWPVNVNGRSFSKQKLQAVIFKVHKDRERERKRLHTYGDMTKRAEAMARKLTEQMEAVTELDQEFALAQEMAAASNSLVDVNDGLVNRGLEIAATAVALQQEIEGLFDLSNLLWYGPTPEFSEMFPDAQGSTTGK